MSGRTRTPPATAADSPSASRRRRPPLPPPPSRGVLPPQRLSSEQQFYYLRLMAKPGQRPEPIKVKFPRWPSVEGAGGPVPGTSGSAKGPAEVGDHRLEDQAIAVVRTIGQAFDLCNRMSQEQTRERQLIEEERTMDSAGAVAGGAAAAGGGTSTGAIAAAAKGGGAARASVASEKSTSSLATVQQRQQQQQQQQRLNSPPFASKRHSIYVPKRTTTTEEVEEAAAADEPQTGDGDDEEEEDEAEELELFRREVRDHHYQKAGPSHKSSIVFPPTNIPTVAPGGAAGEPHILRPALNIPATAGTSTATAAAQMQSSSAYGVQHQQPIATQLTMLPGAQTNPTPLAVPFSSVWNFTTPVQPNTAPLSAQLVQSVDANGNPLYSILPSPTAMSLSSPLLISPYATLQLPPSAAASLASPPSSAEQLQSPSSSENAQRAMIRSQLDQAQQSAQVAACQVQLLRDQLNTETTARLEAQSKTHQLLNSNRELLDQVQHLVSRLQVMENRVAAGLLNHLGDDVPPHQRQSSSKERRALWRTERRDDSLRPDEEEEHDDGTGPGTSAALSMRELRPYQLKTLSDLRAGSLPASEESRTKQDELEDGREHRRQQRRNNDRRRQRLRRRRTDSVDDLGSDDDDEEEEDSTDVNSSVDRAAPGAVDQPSSSFPALPALSHPQARPAPAPSILRKLIPASAPSPTGTLSGSPLGMPLLFGQQMVNRTMHNLSPARRKQIHHQMAYSGPPTLQRPPNDVVLPIGMSKKSLRRFSLQAAELEPEQHKAKKASSSKGVFGQTEFKRMSFNTNPNKKMHDDKSLINIRPTINESEGEESVYTAERRNSRSSPEKKLSSPERGGAGGRRRSSLGVLGKIVGTNKHLLSRLSLRNNDLETEQH
uniref:Uncharacterized protein n=1 Tax=Globodera rostochiensis TaxID=31243 RepID=A0A914H640_GLORO